jgi:hypothetical protein
VLVPVLENHPDRAGADLRRIRGCSLRHGSILSRAGASGNPGAVQLGRGSGCATGDIPDSSDRQHP